MDRPDPRTQSRARFRRLMLWTAATAVLVVPVAILWLISAEGPVTVHMLVATALGAGGAVLMAGLLMGLIFLSDRSGHDDRAGGRQE
jgi:hypothetical protein